MRFGEQIDREVEQRLRKLSRTCAWTAFAGSSAQDRRANYGPQVRSEVIGDAVQDVFRSVQEQKLKVAGYPRIERKEGRRKQLTFSATFEIYPR